MDHGRRETHGSAFSRPSTYAESAADAKELSDFEQIPHPEFSGLNLTTCVSGPIGPAPSRQTSAVSPQHHGIHFADELVQRTPSHLASPELFAAPDNTRKGVLVKRGVDLMSRLYDRPENSHVIRTIRANEAHRKAQENGSPVVVPRPPSGKSRTPQTAFRTTMFKKDFERKLSRKQDADTKPGPVPSLDQIHRKPFMAPGLGMPAKPPLPQIERDIDLESVHSEMDLPVSPSGDKQTDELERAENAPKKVVTFSESALPKSGSQQGDGTPAGSLPPSPNELPTPLPPSPVSLVRLPSHPVSAPSSRPRSGHGTTVNDQSVVLTNPKKNMYDDREPENDDFTKALIGIRDQLGWVSELPRHGPGCRERMETLQDKPDSKKDFEAALRAKDDSGRFFYAVCRNRADPRGRYDPYDLQVVSANMARSSTTYYTASASGISMIDVGPDGQEDATKTPAMWWLWEERLFRQLFELSVFRKFRIWKQFQLWKQSVRCNRSISSKSVLTKTLFSANEVLQGCLLHVRTLCEAASGSLTGLGTGDAAIALILLDKSKTCTLNEFLQIQSEQGDQAFRQLTALRNKVIGLVWESCTTVAEMEGITHGVRPEGDRRVTIKEVPATNTDMTGNNPYKMKTKYGDVPIPEKKDPKRKDKPSYAQLSEWRKILKRLSYFLRSVDFQLLELLRRLVLTATRSLLRFVVASYQTGMIDDSDEEAIALADLVRDDCSQDSGRDSDSSDEEWTRKSYHSGSVGKQSKTSVQTASTSYDSRKRAQNKEDPKQSSDYVVPRFDFEQPEEVHKPPDIDEVLDQIKTQHEVVELPEPVISIQLVLNVPVTPDPKFSTRRRSSVKARDAAAALRAASGGDATAITSMSTMSDTSKNSSKNKVKFTDESGDSESNDSDYDESDEESYESEEETKKEAPKKNRFAYEDDASVHDASKPTRAMITLSPSEYEVKNSFRGIVQGFENTVARVGSMLREPKLEVFYSAPKQELKLMYDEEKREEQAEELPPWPDTEILFGDDPEHQSLIGELMEYITNTLDMVADYSQDFEQYTSMVDKASRVDVESSMAKKQWSTEEFQHVLAIHSDQIRQMKSMIKRRRLGLIKVLSQNYCDSCLPHPTQVITAVTQKLPVIALKRNENLLNIIKGASKKLDNYPNSVEEFVEHLSFLGKMTSEMPALEKEYAIVLKLYTIAKDFEVQIEPEELALYQTLPPSFQHLKTTILYAEAKKDDNIRKFSSDLDKLIHNIRFKITDIKNRVRDPVLLSGETMAVSALERISFLTEEVTELSTKARSYGNYQERFGSSLTQQKKQFSEEYLLMDKRDDNSAQEMQTDLSEIERDLTLRRLLWESAEEWDRLSEEWTSTPFDSLSVESLQKSVNRFTQTVYMLEKGLPSNEVVPRLKEKVIDFKLVMPCITSLRNPSLKHRHWEQIEKIIGKSIVRDKSFTLGDLLEMNIIKHKDRIQEISTTASNEGTLERMLQKVIDLWQSTDFRLVPHSSQSMFIIAAADDILAQLEESQVTIGTIRGSRYVTPIKASVEEWERKLALFARTLDEWMVCQRNWLYLEQIFTTPDIQRQLPVEAKLFIGVDKSWKDIMRRTEDRPNALKSATAPGVLEMLQAANSNLEKIQKCLEDYLETKRLVFPRFYFLSNDELLDILAQSKNPDAVQPHLGKCFGNISALDIKQIPRQPPTVKTITSAEGEIIGMPKNVRARGPVEQWLCSVETGMFDTVKRHLKLGLQDWIGISHDKWVLKHPGQVVLTVAQIMFNKSVVNCFLSSDPHGELLGFQNSLVETLNVLAGLVSSNLVPHKRMSINALLTIDVHSRDILNSMIENNVTKRDDFEWTRQLRYEWDEQTNNCNVMQSNANFTYGYEYLGCSPRLVITPLTDRCYLTLTGALHLHLGGSPAGPAGTGKTETVKDLAKAIGKQCVVFNCSEGLDFKMLGKFFSGLAQSGSWICFDEFNRLDVEVLSVVAQQIHTIKAAKDLKAPRFVFEGRDIKLNITCGFFVTMNPSYAGRVDLPDNLKSLFRPVAMMVPDYTLIAEIILFSEGFTSAMSLSTKIVNLYQLASKQLSQQDHYDFGMRAIKSVLVMAGQRKRQITISEPGRVLTTEDEVHILIHSLRDANLPKFLAEDVPLYESIMADLFPGVDLPPHTTEALEKSISMSVRDQGLQHWPNQMEKVKQFYSQIQVRHGVMLVGPTGGGKTTVRNILQRALVLLPTISVDDDTLIAQLSGRKSESRRQSVFIHNRTKKGHVETYNLNPKCVKLGELYGETDPNTFEWSDGLIATATRRFAKEMAASTTAAAQAPEELRPLSSDTHVTSVSRQQTPRTGLRPGSVPGEEDSQAGSEVASAAYKQTAILEGSMDATPTDWRWIVLDGPVDTLWVENLNTVLDDSKVLCLANGERISLTNGMRLIFEVDDLSQASPATISRCAMVYMDPVDLGWKPYVKTWLQRLPREIPESGKQHIQALFDHCVDRGLAFIRHYAKWQMVPAPEMSFVTALCNIIYAFLDFMLKHGGFGSADKETARPPSADSESGHSRGSSRSGSRAERRRKRVSKKSLAKAGRKEELDTISEKTKNTFGQGKTYFMERNPGNLPVLVGKLFVFAYTWSFGGNFKRVDEMDDDGGISRKANDKRDFTEVDIASEFDTFVHEMFEVEPPIGVRLPASSKSIYSYFVDMDSGNFVMWESLVPTTQSLIEKGVVITIGDSMGVSSDDQQSKGSGDSGIVTTVDTVRYAFLSGLLLVNKVPVLLTGESGVGKSAIIKYLLKRLEKEGGTSFKSGTVLGSVFNFTDKNQALLDNISSLTKATEDDEKTNMDLVLGTASKPKQQTGVISSNLQFSAQTSADRTILSLTHKLIKKGRDTLGAPKGKKVIVFMDDLNMPAPETYGAQPPLELLRQFLDLGGYYDTKKLVWKDVLDVTLIGACGPPGGGRNPVSPRLLRHFCMLALPQPSTRSLQHIYQVQLGRFFQEQEFMPEVKDSLFPLISASIAIYYKMCATMRPTPAKIHYTFNIRDLSQVVSGLFQADGKVVVNSDNCAQLFAHEATRVFHDRLVNHEDKAVFFQMLGDNLHDYFKVKWTPEQLQNEPFLFADFLDESDTNNSKVYKPVKDRVKLLQSLEELYMRQNVNNTQAPQLVFFKDAVEHVLRAARNFRQPGGHMLLVGLDGCGKSTTVQLASFLAGCDLQKLILTRGYGLTEFRDDLKKICFTAGVKGKNTVFLLADGDIVHESFLEDVNCILNSGEVPDLFDNEEIDGIAMELKAAAAAAQIPDTRNDVYQYFIQRVKTNLHIVLAMSPAGTKFRQRCRMNPSLINCCTIDWYEEWDTEAMLSVAKVYFQGSDFICEEGQDPDELRTSAAVVCVDIHSSVRAATKDFWEEMKRRYYVTPSSYMELIRIYSNMLSEKKTEFVNNRQRLLVGLSRLSEANSLVGTMQDELVALGPKIIEKQKDTEMLLAQLEKDQEAVDQVREIVEAEETVMKKETQVVQEYAEECQRDLASVIPALQSAIQSLDSLDKADISEIRVYSNPPELVTMVMAAVCVLLQEKADWATAKKVLADAQFLKKLINFDKNAVPEKVFAKLKKYSKHPDFTPQKVHIVSLACRSMCQWVLALEHYHEVYKMAKPKQRRVDEAKEALQLAQNNLAQKQASLQKIQDHLKMLQQQYQDSVNQRESLKQRQVLTGLRLERASVLIEALVDEKVRWAESVDDLDFKLKGLVGDTLVSASAVAYLGAFTNKYRHNMLLKWVEMCKVANIPISDSYNFVKSMADANQILRWQNEALPQDTHSTENAIIVKHSRKWPLLIDPQGQASLWIKAMEGHKLKVIQAADPNYMRTMERAIRVGEPVLLQEVTEYLDPSLKPILQQETFTRSGHVLIRLGDTEIEYNPNFRLYLATSMGNPHYLPAVCIQVTLINFTVTFDGLQEQLLSSVVKQERPQLEQERSQLLESIANDLQALRDLEDRSLGLLQNSQGHILDDQDLVETLQKSKGMSGEIEKRIYQSEDAEKKLNAARKKYLPVATRGAVIYFVLADLAGVDVMYQFSLSWFQGMFTNCIDITNERPCSSTPALPAGRIRPNSARSSPRPDTGRREDDEDLSGHMQRMIDRLTSNIYKIVSVALFANHQQTFSFMLCCGIMKANAKYGRNDSDKTGYIQALGWTVFLQGNVMASMMDTELLDKYDGFTSMQRLEVTARGGVGPSRPKWITETMWTQAQHLESSFKQFETLCLALVNNHTQWNAFYKSLDPYHLMKNKFTIPDNKDGGQVPNTPGITPIKLEDCTFPWEELTCFQRLIIIKVLCPCHLISASYRFVEEQMGTLFVTKGGLDLREMFEESSAKTPLIFILSPGADPSSLLLRFAKELRGSTLHLDMISLGRGQGPKAEELISKAQILKGRWLFLQNCHLAASWMPRLQTIVDNFNKPNADIDPQFRLWLSSKPDPCFPISILQSGLKMTVEPPRGVKANLLRNFASGGGGLERSYEEVLTDKPAWKSLLFGLCFFNACIHERKKYGRLGWNIPYEFNDSDFEVSLLQLQMLLEEQDEIPWPALWYLTGEVTYGGRVTDDWDRRCLHSLLQKFYTPKSLQDVYHYTTDTIYHPLPPHYSFSDVKSYIEGLPVQDSPELFGMNKNAENAALEFQAKELIDTVLSVQPRLANKLVGSGKTSDEVVLDLASDMIKNVPEAIDVDDAEPKSALRARPTLQDIVKIGTTRDLKAFKRKPQGGKGKAGTDEEKDKLALDAIQKICQSALFTVLRQEIDRFNNLLSIIGKSLKSLVRAVKGEVVMSEHLEEAYYALLSQKVPAQWKSASYESCKPLGPWVKDLIQRVDFFTEWVELVVGTTERVLNPPAQAAAKGESSQIELPPTGEQAAPSQPRSFWLSSFFFPQGFLTAVQQNHARKIGVSVDSLTFGFKVIPSSEDTDESLNDVKLKLNVKDIAFKASSPPSDGVLVFGLYLDGARWDLSTNTLADSLPGSRYCRLPELHFIPVVDPNGRASSTSLESPLVMFKTREHGGIENYESPLYRTSARAGTLSSTGMSTNFVTSVFLPSAQPSQFWIMRGVALLCQLDD